MDLYYRFTPPKRWKALKEIQLLDWWSGGGLFADFELGGEECRAATMLEF